VRRFCLEYGCDVDGQLLQQCEVVTPNLARVRGVRSKRVPMFVRTRHGKCHDAADPEPARAIAPRCERRFGHLRDARFAAPDRTADRAAAFLAIVPTLFDAVEIALRVAGRAHDRDASIGFAATDQDDGVAAGLREDRTAVVQQFGALASTCQCFGKRLESLVPAAFVLD
jgi:hypothetical protein